MLALDGVRVLDFSQMMLGPFATQLLGDLGADVIKVERPEGEWERSLPMMGGLVDGDSAAFLAMNRNKRSVALDLKDPRAREALLRLTATCDVVVENFRPGVMDRLGLGYDDLAAVRPDIIVVSGTGWGRDTVFARQDRPGQDLLIQAASGLAANGGRAGDPPTPAGTAIVDHATALTLANAVLAALLARARHGVGQRVDVDLFSTAVAMQCQEISALVNQGTDFVRSERGVAQAWLAAPYGVYRAADGWLAVAMTPLPTLAGVLAAPALPALDAWRDRDEVKALVEDAVAGRPVEELLEALLAAGVWAARVRSTREAVDELRDQGSDLLVTVEHGTGRSVELVGCPIRFSATPWQQRLPPPAVGQHTREVLAEVLSDDELDALAPLAEAR
jgi:crotonobetainyl-CoA:carnitine CoA-transferase CaiB-like acyl-CoA transferase